MYRVFVLQAFADAHLVQRQPESASALHGATKPLSADPGRSTWILAACVLFRKQDMCSNPPLVTAANLRRPAKPAAHCEHWGTQI